LVPTARNGDRGAFGHEDGFPLLNGDSSRLPLFVTRIPRHCDQLADLPHYGRDLARRGGGTHS
jgi:hypothetical protein